jgi:hypothetical protein
MKTVPDFVRTPMFTGVVSTGLPSGFWHCGVFLSTFIEPLGEEW